MFSNAKQRKDKIKNSFKMLIIHFFLLSTSLLILEWHCFRIYKKNNSPFDSIDKQIKTFNFALFSKIKEKKTIS